MKEKLFERATNIKTKLAEARPAGCTMGGHFDAVEHQITTLRRPLANVEMATKKFQSKNFRRESISRL